MSRTSSWRLLLAETESRVGDRQHARWLCETAAGVSTDEFVDLLDDAATERMVAHLDSMVARLNDGEPIQYVIGRWPFRHVDLAIDRRVLIPRPETELVAGAAIDLAAAAGPIRTVADLGTGSGAIGLALADELPVLGTTVWITDRSRDALDVARANLAGLGRSAANVRVGHGSWFEPLPAVPAFDVIVANPPYVAEGAAELDGAVAAWEPSAALVSGSDGLDDLRLIVAGAIDRLRPGGWLVVEHGHDQGAAVRELLRARGYTAVETLVDLAGRERFAVAQRPSALLGVRVEDGEVRVRHLLNRVEEYALLMDSVTRPEGSTASGAPGRAVDLAAVLAEYGPGGAKERADLGVLVVELDGVVVGDGEIAAGGEDVVVDLDGAHEPVVAALRSVGFDREDVPGRDRTRPRLRRRLRPGT